MKNLRSILGVCFIMVSLSAFSADEAKERLFPDELSENLSLLSLGHCQRRNRDCDSSNAHICKACKQPAYCCDAHQQEDMGVGHRVACKNSVDVIKGQRDAYGYVEQVFKSGDDFFARFFTLEDLQEINKRLLQAINKGLLGKYAPSLPDEGDYGRFRQLESFAVLSPEWVFQCNAEEFQRRKSIEFFEEMKPELLAAMEKKARLAIPFNERGDRQYRLVLKHSFSVEIEGLNCTDERYVNILTHNGFETRILGSNRSEVSLCQSISYSEKIGGEALVESVERLLGKLKARLTDARGDEREIIKIAAAAHMGLLRLEPFYGANKRTARVVMNAILRYSGLTAARLDDPKAYNTAIAEDLKVHDGTHFYELLLKERS